MTYVIVQKRCLLQQILDKKRLTQSDLVIMTGIAKQQISEYIKNKRLMSLPNAFLISHALNCSVDDLYEFEIKKKSE